MIAGIIALLTALPELFKLLNRLGDVVSRFMTYADKNNLNGWINSLEASIDKLEKAQTPDEKLQAAADLASVIRKL